MYFRSALFIALHLFSILLPAQNVLLFQKPHDITRIQKSMVLQTVEELELIEQKCSGIIGKNENRIAYANVDLRPVSVGEVVEHSWYTLSYSEENEQALWVYYKLTSEMLNGVTPRVDKFRVDNRVSSLSAHPEDYTGSGYDRGHLCPAADMTLNQVSMSESFYMSNISPQAPAFNRGIWKKLEGTVRNWAIIEKEIHIVTGPVFKDNLGVLPNCNVTVPGYYYKVIFDSTDEPKMIALVLPNTRGEKQLAEYVVTVNYVEALTGIDFFEALPDDIENKLEATFNTALWEFREYRGAAPAGEISVQCNGTTRSTGQRCRNKTKNQNHHCQLHQSQAAGK